MAEWSECWTCNSEALEVHARPDRSLDLFWVVPSANLWPRLSKNQLVCLLPVGILNHVMFHLNYLFHNTEYLKLEVRIKLGGGVLGYKSDGGACRKISKTSLKSTRILFYGRVANLFPTLRGTANFTANYTANFNSDNDNVQQLSSQELFESIVINLYPNKVYYF